MTNHTHLRRLPLCGTSNTRELGGYPCCGGHTEWGVFLRSDLPENLSEGDVSLLREYGVRSVLDLRRHSERTAQPCALCGTEGFMLHELSINDNIDSIDFEGDVKGSMSGLYIFLLEHSGAAIADIFKFFAQEDGGILFHCAAGKDRTGVIAMLLLKLAGVSDEDVTADYAITDIYKNEPLNTTHNTFTGAPMQEYVLRSKPESMRRTLRHLQEKYGDAESYLLQAGADAQALWEIKRRFVKPL